ncbi:type II secretion system protein [Sporolactobacillus terrae]|uniref:Prepilin-type cleavage/methylation domain-containing protein n=1 Tax=Sporolactobacillus terrae TaxID=269673 RepID=A0ABX5Q8F5_9BACL|nr:prepilin-type N-terminal cleavage/methylation domain-containing protein [Sporolactobacillus terrae]QAA22887.1 prepilin-type cleavage/methylation domain-containing protein [Sporolactobacillus terrae]QAA25860.1 prepilin-type cleavage/methylation domain-containing protein [Sporolactobacillus terrae]UAK17734.1 prepilin-type N-terminal cleavage/methylation domain-containing protein [Sporolactobacillus terrae]
MIQNSKGVTLVEMLAVIVVATICLTLIFSIWLSGEKSVQRTMTQNDLQADAHLVQVRITRAFYDQVDKPFTLTVNGGKVTLSYEGGTSQQPEVISNPDLVYTPEQGVPNTVNVKDGSRLTLDYTITERTASSLNNLPSFHLKTTLNYPWKDDVDEESESSGTP